MIAKRYPTVVIGLCLLLLCTGFGTIGYAENNRAACLLFFKDH